MIIVGTISPDTPMPVRIRPAHYARLQLLQARLGLRPTAGAWEYMLRVGFAASANHLSSYIKQI